MGYQLMFVIVVVTLAASICTLPLLGLVVVATAAFGAALGRGLNLNLCKRLNQSLFVGLGWVISYGNAL